MLRLAPGLLALAAVCACAGHETSTADVSSGHGRSVPEVSEVRSWSIQLSGLEAPGAIDRLARTDADLLVVDRVNTGIGQESFPMKQVVAKLQASRGRTTSSKLVLAYLNVGQAEDYRTYWAPEWKAPGPDARGEPDFMLAEDPNGWPGNFPVAYWEPAWRDIVLALADGAVADGFDGVMLDWAVGFIDSRVAAAAQADGVDPLAAMVTLVRDLSARARQKRPGFVVLVNGLALPAGAPDLVDAVNGLLQESVSFAGHASDTWEDPKNSDQPLSAVGEETTDRFVSRLGALRDLGFAVFILDYASAEENREKATKLALRNGFVPCVSRSPLNRIPDHQLRR